MKKSLKILFVTLLGLTIAGAAIASTLPTYTASTFETYLANQQATTDTIATLATGTLRDGTTFTGFQCITIDANTPTQEYECGTANGTSLTGLSRGIDAVSGTTTVAALVFPHRRGADVKISDYPVLTLINRILNGVDSFSNLISYSPTTATSTLAGGNIPDAAWVLAQTQAVTSVSDDGRSTLTISPTSGPVLAGLNLTHNNVWTAASTTFVGGLTTITATTTSATSTSFFATTASTTNLLVGGKIGVGTSTPADAVTVSNNQSILVSENKVATSTSQTIDWTKGNQQLMQIGTSAITVTQTNYLPGQHILIISCNPGAGTAGAITWSGVEWAGSSVPTQTTGTNLCDAWSFIATQATSTNGTYKLFGTAALNFN